MRFDEVVLRTLLGLGVLFVAPSCESARESEPRFVDLPVTVVDELDQPLQGATVTAINVGSDVVVTEVTASDGTTSIGDAVGIGNVLIYAERGEYVGFGAYVEWSCDESRCGPDVPNLTLKLGRSVTCTAEYVVLPVEVVDSNGAPLVGATVTATNLRSGKTISDTTRTDGFATSIGEAIGGGMSQIVATFQSRQSAPTNVNWTCGDCHCLPEHEMLTLVIPDG